MESGSLPETGADVGILAATGTNNTQLDGVDDGIVRNQGDAAAAAMTSGGGIQNDCNDGSGSRSDDADEDEDDDEEDMDDEEVEEEAEPTTRWDVFQALQKVIIPGNFCAGGCADGSTTITPSLPTTLGLRVTSGKTKADLPLPITDAHTRQLRAMSWKVDDESYHNVRQIEAECIKITNPAWEASLTKLLRTASLQLGVTTPGRVRAELDMMLMFQRGSSIDRCCNTGEDENVLGTLMIQMPSNFTGGAFNVWDYNTSSNADQDDENSNDNDEDNIVKSFDLGSGARSTAPFSCHYLCHYSDCNYEMEKIKSGTRLMLMYSLVYEGNATKPNARRRRLGMAPLERSLEMLPRFDRLFAVPLTKTYGSTSLATKGLNALKVKDRGTIETIRVAAKSGWKLTIVYATRTDVEERRSGDCSDDMYGCGYDERVTHSSSKTKLLRVVDETGKESANDTIWLSKVLSLDSCEGADGKGMTLARAPTPAPEQSNGDDYYSSSDDGTEKCKVAAAQPYSIADVWGGGKKMVKVKESNPYDCRYSMYETRATHTTSYSGSFLLAYDESSEFEMKCLSGGDAIGQAVDQVCNAQDLDLLERLLLLMENNARCKLSGKHCAGLLRLIHSSSGTSTFGNNWKVEYSGMVIGTLATTVEPSEVLFDLIQNTIQCHGWRPFRERVSKIMRNGTRKYLTLLQFLVRVSFLLKLRSSVSEFERYEVDPATPCLFDNCFTDFAKSQSADFQSEFPAILSTIVAMVGRHGWTVLVERAVKQCFDSMLHTSFERIDRTIDLAQLFLKFKSIDQAASSMENYLGRLVAASVSALKKLTSRNGRFSRVDPKLTSRNGRFSRVDPISNVCFMDLMRLILQHGNDDDCAAFGLWISSDSNFEGFCRLLDKLASPGNVDLWLELLDKCLIGCNAPLMTVLHISKIIEKFPEIPQTVSSDGRIPLHHATATECACFDTIELLFKAYPKGASTVDPVTGMYPFMLAGASGIMDATFKLLVADPSLVGGALCGEGKKRKRSPSMD